MIWATATQFIPMLRVEVESLLEQAGLEHHDWENQADVQPAHPSDPGAL
jgi:hypothetical protein